jgi:hypothetical protein
MAQRSIPALTFAADARDQLDGFLDLSVQVLPHSPATPKVGPRGRSMCALASYGQLIKPEFGSSSPTVRAITNRPVYHGSNTAK